ncbi:conserved hypothetical protein [Altererythrobacter sp. B11]|uniref:chemotaxis protein CheW n=1 Tax=Altererythrobacter sp. B11 TaxID=2060312 RepID=UPI000DC6E2CD|nr:chemotaxis protein CheW [Altererythrobacter sp. B11]BBC71789.1 conserved hypothetical protein [Altererythrobacter sp. B11]
MNDMLLVIALGGRQAVLAADAVDAVIEVERRVPVPGAPPHVAGLAALRSRPLTLVDCRAAMGLAPADADEAAAARAVVIEQGGHLYGLLVDQADAIVAATAAPGALGADPGAGWRRACRAMVPTEAGLLPLLDIATLIAGPGETVDA